MNKFEQYLNEAAMGLGNYALYVSERLTYLYINDDELKEALESYDLSGMEKKVLFVFGIKEDMYMDAVWAQKGYCPIAYTVALSIAPEGVLAPQWQADRVTKSAANIWKEFFNGKGKDDVTLELVGVDPDNYRSYWYRIKTKVNFSKNVKAHKDFLKDDKYNEKSDQLNELADGLLINAMRAIY